MRRFFSLFTIFVFVHAYYSCAQDKVISPTKFAVFGALPWAEALLIKSNKSQINSLIKDNGSKYVRNIQEGIYLAVLDSSVRRKYDIQIIGSAALAHKLSPALTAEACNELLIHWLDLEQFKKELLTSKISVEILYEYKAFRAIAVRLNKSNDLEHLILMKSVVFIDCYQKQIKEETFSTSLDLSINRVNKVHAVYNDLAGKGFTISIKERSIDPQDIDLRKRVAVSVLSDPEFSLHANQMATIIAGGGNSIYKSKGVAWKSKVSSSSYENLMPDDYDVFRSEGILIQNHSYGSGLENYYGIEASAYDAAIYENPLNLHVFSSGNSGEMASSFGKYAGIPGFASLTGNIKSAKNVLTVGAIDRDENIDKRSSKGPANDGRIKPEIVAFGAEGTSDAAALVSGICTLIQEYYLKLYSKIPTIDLIKSALIATAKDVGTEGIDFSSGYGSVDAFKSIQLIQKGNFYQDSVKGDETRFFLINIPPNIERLCLALSWIDPHANPGEQRVLLNDLDLVVENMSSHQSWLPWTLSEYPHYDSLAQSPKRREDHTNNTEYITLEKPEAGTYRVAVKGFDLRSSIQTYSLAYWLDPTEMFYWTYPLKTDYVVSEEPMYFRWETTLDNKAELEISLNNGPFELISDNVNIRDGYYEWIPPKGIYTATARISSGTSMYYLQETFTISPLLEVSVSYNCDSTASLSWPRIQGINEYQIYSMSDMYLMPLTLVSDTIFFIAKPIFSNSFLAVAPVVNGQPAVSGPLVDYESSEVNCFYVDRFNAFLSTPEAATLSIKLSSRHLVEKIRFEKLKAEEFEVISKIDVNDLWVYEFLDNNLESGINEYRVTIELTNGTLVHTNTAQVYFANSLTFVLFPNPLTPETELNIITDGVNLSIRIYDATGRIRAHTSISGLFFTYKVESFKQGLYLYTIFRGDSPVKSGKFIVN